MALDLLGLALIDHFWKLEIGDWIEKLTLEWHQIGTGLASNGKKMDQIDSGLCQGLALDWSRSDAVAQISSSEKTRDHPV